MNLTALAFLAALSWAGAVSTLTAPSQVRSLYRSLGDVPKNSPRSAHPGKVYEIPETTLNAFAAELLQEKKAELREARLELIDDKVVKLTATGRLDWAKVFKSKGDSPTGRILAKAGGVESTLTARLQTASAKRMAYFRVLSIKVNGISLPDSFVAELLRYLGSRQRPPQDYSRLFPLPYGIQKLEIKKGLLVVHL